MPNEVRWTAKLPALIAGVFFLLAGAVGLRRSLVLGGVLMLLGAAFIGYSLTIKEWCAQVNYQQSAFSSAFAPSFHGCLRQKGWLEL